jgi:hypothetical protein
MKVPMRLQYWNLLLGLVDKAVLFQNLIFQTSLNMNKEDIDESDCIIMSVIAHYLSDLLTQNEFLHKLIAYLVQISKVCYSFHFS